MFSDTTVSHFHLVTLLLSLSLLSAATVNKELSEVRAKTRLIQLQDKKLLRFEYKESENRPTCCSFLLIGVCVCGEGGGGVSCLNQFTPAQLETINKADDCDHISISLFHNSSYHTNLRVTVSIRSLLQ